MAPKTFLDCLLAANRSDPGMENSVPYLNGGSTALYIKSGVGTFVSGAATIATGLDSVNAFVATIFGATGFATGATEISDTIISSITTGSVVVKGTFNAFVTGAATISVSGTGQFHWWAIGPVKV